MLSCGPADEAVSAGDWLTAIRCGGVLIASAERLSTEERVVGASDLPIARVSWRLHPVMTTAPAAFLHNIDAPQRRANSASVPSRRNDEYVKALVRGDHIEEQQRQLLK